MSKTNNETVTKLTDTEVIAELRKSNKQLREQLQLAEQDKETVSNFFERVTYERLEDMRDLLNVLPNVRKDNSALLRALHSILDETIADVQLLCGQCFDALKDNLKEQTDKLFRGTPTL